ncbi:unnamed protein product [Prunus armeniaca]|uniref:Uncharacterized protein n=1 Tax=Prunus armeniaca TaxID=36596 RepID=A0A6J5TZT5_PRUAR|nr:unnamed protein product [Prunus armeniaca]
MTVNETESLCLNSVDSSLAKMVGPPESGSFEYAVRGSHSTAMASSESGFSLAKSRVVTGLGSDSGSWAWRDRLDDVRTAEKAKIGVGTVRFSWKNDNKTEPNRTG